MSSVCLRSTHEYLSAYIATIVIQPSFAFHEARRCCRAAFTIVAKTLDIFPDAVFESPSSVTANGKSKKNDDDDDDDDDDTQKETMKPIEMRFADNHAFYPDQGARIANVGVYSSRKGAMRAWTRLRHRMSSNVSGSWTPAAHSPIPKPIRTFASLSLALENATTQLDAASTAVILAETYAPSIFCTELPIIGNDRDLHEWIADAKVLTSFMLTSTRAILQYTGDQTLHEEDMFDAMQGEGIDDVRSHIMVLIDYYIRILDACSARVVNGSKTPFMNRITDARTTIAKCVGIHMDDDDESLRALSDADTSLPPPDEMQAHIKSMEASLTDAIISYLRHIRPVIEKDSTLIDSASLSKLNAIIVTGIVIRAYAVRLISNHLRDS